MDIKILTQPQMSDGSNFTLGETIINLLASKKPKFTEVNFMFGIIKSNILEVVKPYFTSFITNGGKINFYTGFDKKFNSKPIISELLSIGCNVYFFSPEDSLLDFQYRGVIFESSTKAKVFFTSGNFSMGGLYTSFTIINSLSYNLSSHDDKTDFKNLKSSIIFDKLAKDFTLLSEDSSDNLGAKNVIPSIQTYNKKNSPEIGSHEIDSNIQIEIDENVEFSIPVETPKPEKKVEKTKPTEIREESAPKKYMMSDDIVEYPQETVYYGADDVVDVENLLFSGKSKKARPVKKEVEEAPTTPVEEIASSKIIVKPADPSKTAIFMFECPKITTKGVCAGEIKIPVYLRDLTASFWSWPENYSCLTVGSIKEEICTFKIFDTLEPSKEKIDKNVRLFQREAESSFTISSKILSGLGIGENDILRLIKVTDEKGTYYTCEIIRQDSKEYNIWEQFCVNTVKGTKRRYGIM